MTFHKLGISSFLSLSFLLTGFAIGTNAQSLTHLEVSQKKTEVAPSTTLESRESSIIDTEVSQKKPEVIGQNSTPVEIAPEPEAELEQKPTSDPDFSLQLPEPLTYDEFVSSLGTTISQISELQTIGNLSTYDIQVVNVNDLIIDRFSTQNDHSNRSEMARLHTALSQEDAIVEALDNSNVAIDSVIGVNVLQDGNVVIFYQ